MKALILGTMVLTGVGTGALASAEPGTSTAPRLYTNDDLDRLGPPPAAPSQPVYGADDAGWDYVQRFIDAEYARSVTERTLDMEERRRALEDDALQALNDRTSFVGPYYGDWNTGYPYPGSSYLGSYVGLGYGYGARPLGARPPHARHHRTNRHQQMGARPSMGRPGASGARARGTHAGSPAAARAGAR